MQNAPEDKKNMRLFSRAVAVQLALEVHPEILRVCRDGQGLGGHEGRPPRGLLRGSTYSIQIPIYN